jgi:hypothetical protein
MHEATKKLLLIRRGVVFVDAAADRPLHDLARPVAIELAELGYALTDRLRARLACLPIAELTVLRAWIFATLAAEIGANRKHEPLFRSFPDGIPADTEALWWQKLLGHYLQAPAQPCLFCRRVGTTHVLNPCAHVVCDHCFDGTSYSACPTCERQVDRRSPFFRASAERPLPALAVRFKLLDLGEHPDREAQALLTSLCERKQALSPDDRSALVTIVHDYGERALALLPPTIPVKENIALVFGTLLHHLPDDLVLHAAKKHLATATDVLRLVAAYSNVDPSLQGEARWKNGKAITVHRFRVAPMRRRLRHQLFELLERCGKERLSEDMLRHRSYWVWLGEFLHPHEHARKYPAVAAAFAHVRRHDPDGNAAPPFHGFNARVEAALAARNLRQTIDLLSERPGDMARRFDHLLRAAPDPAIVLAAFDAAAPNFATPVLLTLAAMLPTRARSAKQRLFFPKGSAGIGVIGADKRPSLPQHAIDRALGSIESTLLTRFAKQPPFLEALIDEPLATVIVPFNERTASPAAVSLPRGSSLPLLEGKTLRLFLHWCEPAHGGEATDIDLSVGFYDDHWEHVGVCSYYQLKLDDVAVSAGDLRNAPFPDGASEFVDVNRRAALDAGMRYAVMVVNAFSGMPFSRLERAFAGVMLRDDVHGAHFDPRSVELKFNVQGEHGIFMPLVIDLRSNRLHWLDTYSRGQLHLNNVANSNRAITQICPAMIDYFASGVRMSMLDLALLHAAARCDRVFLRNASGVRLFQRAVNEAPRDFLRRLRAREGERTGSPMGEAPIFAALYRGDRPLPDGSTCYALFREQLTRTIAAADLIT